MTTVDAVSGGTAREGALARQQKLAANVSTLRARGGALAANDRWMLVVGGVLLPLGVVLVLLGWLGASRTPLVFEQVPYLISGGLLGLSLVVSGGFVYFAYWMTLMVRETRKGRDDLNAGLLRLEVLLAGSAPADLPAARAARTPAAASPDLTADDLVATKAGTMMHRRDCTVVAGRDGLRSVTEATPGLTACRLCEPLL